MRARYIILYVLTIFVGKGVCYPQHFVALDNSGELKILDGNQFEISFYSINGFDTGREASFFDTGYYKIEGDTLFLSSRTRSWAEVVNNLDTTGLNRIADAHYLIERYGITETGKWFRTFKYIVPMAYQKCDTIVLYCPWVIHRESILSVYDNIISKRLLPDVNLFGGAEMKKDFYIKIFPEKVDRIYLSDFPLLIQGNKLVPIDRNKIYRCLVYNGFIFPELVLSGREVNIDKISIQYRGEANLHE